MLKTVGGERADFSGREPGINVPRAVDVERQTILTLRPVHLLRVPHQFPIIVLFSTYFVPPVISSPAGELMAPSYPDYDVYYLNVAGLTASSGAQSYVTHPCQGDRDFHKADISSPAAADQ